MYNDLRKVVGVVPVCTPLVEKVTGKWESLLGRRKQIVI